MLPHGGVRIETSRDKRYRTKKKKKKSDVSPAMGKKPLWSGADLWLLPQVANVPDRVKRMS